MSIRVLGRTLDPQGWKTATLADIWARRYRVRARLLQALVRREGVFPSFSWRLARPSRQVGTPRTVTEQSGLRRPG